MARLAIGPANVATWRRRAGIAAAVVVVLAVLVGVVGFFVAPGIVRSVAEQRIAEATGRRIAIDAVRLNPFTLAATIDGFRLYAPDGTTVVAEVDRLVANVSSASIVRRALVLDELRVERPRLVFARLGAQRFDFSDIVDRIAARPKDDAPPPGFSLNNIRIEEGRLAFDDHVTGRKHVVEHLDVGVPFVSNLPYATDVVVTPHFAADIDGSHLALDGQAQPFAANREATMTFDVADLDVPSFVDFVPAKLNFRIARAKLAMKVVVAFKAAGHDADGKPTPQSLVLSGRVGLADVSVTDLAGREAIAVGSVDAEIARLAPLTSDVELASLAIVEPRIRATRDADGRVDLASLFAPPGGSTRASPASATDAPATASPTASGSAAASAPLAPTASRTASTTPAATTFSIGTATIRGGAFTLTDDALGGETATTSFAGIDVRVDRFATQGAAPTAFDVTVRTPEGGTIVAKGTAVVGRRVVDATVGLRGFRPGAFSRYLATFVAARIGDGTVDADAHVALDGSGATVAGRIDRLGATVVNLKSLLPNEKAAFVAADAIALSGGSFDLGTRTFAADALTITAPTVALRRDAKGRLNVAAALVDARAAKPERPVAGEAAVVVAPSDTRPFVALVKALTIERGDVSLDDDAPKRPVHVRIAPLDVRLENVGTALDRALPFKVAATIDRRGKLAVEGRLTVAPLAVDASIDATAVPVGWLAGYAGDRLNVVVDSADLDARGTLRVQTPASASPSASPSTATARAGPPHVAYRGSLGVTRMRALDRLTSEEFVRWKSLSVPKIDFYMPARNAPLAVLLGSVALDDFYARLIVNANGRVNVQDVVARPGQAQSVTKPEDDASADAATRTAADVAKPADAPGPAPLVRLQGLKLSNGRIGITDNFVKPNYSANLTGLTGTISAIASDKPAPAELTLAGTIDGDGALTVSGKVDPFASALFVDVAAEAKDIELTRLTPYAIKYAGYGIERGKLSTTVRYHIEDGKLQATNRLRLDRLAFGAHDPDSKADLPVRLAVALLADSKGEIDIELPVSGTLADPQFSVGAVLWRAFVNVIVRAATSPFALIGSAFGGGDRGGELGYIQFQPGVSDLTPEGKEKLATLARALNERPALKLDIIGRYDPATDPDGLRRDHLLDRLKDAKAKEQSKGGDHLDRNAVTIEPGAEYDAYLAKVYDATTLPDKPRNVVGLAKTIPPAEMERLLLANIALDPNDPRWLAEARADVVRHSIEDAGKIPAGRVFLVAPKLNADGITDHGAPNRVDFAIR